jgi:uncharacterized membrane protein YqgA involved in biofilm formation
MLGTVVNALAIAAMGLVGVLLRRGIPENFRKTVLDGMGILLIALGCQYMLQADNLALVGLCLAVGGGLGEWWRWEARLEVLAQWLQSKTPSAESGFVKGFTSASLLFCVGAMGILGALENGLTGNPQLLLVKSMLDGIFSLIFSASLGVGVIFSAIPVLLYQGAISLGAGFLKPFFTEPLLGNVTALGGILIAGIGFNLLSLTAIRIANLLPGLFLLLIVMLCI